MDTDLLRTFVTIVETGSFSRAADVVHRSQSAVSMQVKRLEELAGVPLFERRAQGAVPTRRGEALVGEARRLLRILDQAFDGCSDMSIKSEIRMGFPEEYSQTILPTVLQRYAEAYPKVQLTVHCGLSEQCDDGLENGDLDLALVLSDPGDLRGDMVFHDPVVWVESERHVLHDVEPMPVAVFERGCWWRDHALDALERTGRRFRIAYTSPSVAGIQAAVLSGLAVAVLGASTLRPGIRNLSPLHVLPPLAGSNVLLKRRPNPVVDRAVDTMAAIIKDTFRRGFATA